MKITIEKTINDCLDCPFHTCVDLINKTIECKFAWVKTSWIDIPKECPLLYDKVLTKKYNVEK